MKIELQLPMSVEEAQTLAYAISFTNKVAAVGDVSEMLKWMRSLPVDHHRYIQQAARVVNAASRVRKGTGPLSIWINKAAHEELLTQIKTLLSMEAPDITWPTGAQSSINTYQSTI